MGAGTGLLHNSAMPPSRDPPAGTPPPETASALAPLRAAGLDESARLRVAGVRGPDDLAVLAASWREHALMPTRFERAGLRLEQILRETAA